MRDRMLAILCELMSVPPTLGAQIHLLGLGEAAARHVPTRIFGWLDDEDAPARAWLDAGAGVDRRQIYHAFDARTRPSHSIHRKWHYARRVFAWLREHAAPGSIVWMRESVTALAALPEMAASRRRGDGFRFVFDAASLMRLEYPHAESMRFGPARAALEEWTRGHFDLIRTLSPSMQRYMVDQGVPEDTIVVLPVGSHRRDATWRLPEAGPRRRILYAGSARSWQGLPLLLAAMRIVHAHDPAITLSVVGANAPAGGDDVPPNVTFLGKVPHDVMSSHYLEHDLLVVPRPHVPLTDVVVPMKIAEALAHGVPMVATDLAAIRFVAGDAATYVAPEPDAIADAIVRTLDDPEALRAAGDAARQRFDRFSWDHLGQQLAHTFFD